MEAETAPPPRTPTGTADRPRLIAVAVVAASAIVAAAIVWKPAPSAAPTVASRGTGTLLVALHDVARLETTEVHVERVVDLKDSQSHFFGLVEGADAILLVAVGDAVLGVDLSKLTPGDVAYDEATHAARLRLPLPEVFSARLDDGATYVYSRSTDLLAKHNEHLESEARRQAVASIKSMALEPDHLVRAKEQAEKELRALAAGFGAARVDVEWR